MNWLSFFIGVLLGWLAEWFIDLFYWRRKYQSCQQEKEALQARLNEVERRLRTFQVKGREPEGEPQRIPSAHVTAQQAAIVPPEADLEVALPSAETEVDIKVPEVALPGPDVDVALEAPGVDVPGSGIDAFLDGLKARFPDVDLDGSIARLKARFPRLDLAIAIDGLKADFPDLDIDGAVDGLKARLGHLGAGTAIGGMGAELAERRAELPTTAPGRPDELTLLEGIGPKISQLLRDNGILTMAQLADTSIDRLQAILRAGGPNFQLADPTSWPEQARLAADGAWDELRALQDRLIGGRTTRRRDR